MKNRDYVMEILKIGKEINVTPVLIGVHGIGKTARVKSFAKENNMDLIILEVSKIDPVEFMGRIYEEKDPETGEKYHKYTMPYWLKRIMENDKKGIPTLLFLDEFNRGTKLIINGIMNMITERKFGLSNFKLPDSTYIVAAMNPDTGLYNTNYIDDAQFDRFLSCYIEPDFEQWKEDFGFKNIEIEIINFLEENKKYFYFQLDNGNKKVSLTPRKWEIINRIIKEYKNKKIDEKTLNYILFNLMGTVSSIFIKYLKEDVFTFKKFKEFVDKHYNNDIDSFIKKFNETNEISPIHWYNILSGLLYNDIENLKNEKKYIKLFTEVMPSEILAALLSNKNFKEKLLKIIDSKKEKEEITKKEAIAALNDLFNTNPELKSEISIDSLLEE